MALAVAVAFTLLLNGAYAKLVLTPHERAKVFAIAVAMPFGVKPLLSTLNGRRTYDGRHVSAVDVDAEDFVMRPDGLVVHETKLQDFVDRGIYAERVAVIPSLGSSEFRALAAAHATFPTAAVVKAIGGNQLAEIREALEVDSRSLDTDTLRITRVVVWLCVNILIFGIALMLTHNLGK